MTPIEPEDLLALSLGIDRILNYVSDLVKESEAMASAPDEAERITRRELYRRSSRIGEVWSRRRARGLRGRQAELSRP